MIRNSMSMLLVLTLTGLVIGCSQSQGAQNGVHTVNAWVMGTDGYQTYYSKLGDKFNQEHHDVQVRLEFIPWDQGHDKLIAAAAADAGPDVTTDGGRWTAELAAMDALYPLDEFITDEYKHDFVDAAWATTQYQGKTWGIPQGFTTTALFYRTDWLQEAGYTHAPRTWNEFRDLAQKMTKNNRFGYGLVGHNSFETTMFWTPFLWQAGGELLSPDLKKAAFHSPAGIEALQFYVDLYHNNSVPRDALSTKRNDSQTMFTGGLVGMTTTVPAFAQEIKRTHPDLKWATAFYPEGKQMANLATTDHIVMLKTAKNKQAAWRWIDYVTNQENALAWSQFIGFVPTRKSGLLDQALRQDENMETFLLAAMHARSYPTLPEWPQIDETIADAVQLALAGKKTPKEALDDAARKVDKILAEAQ